MASDVPKKVLWVFVFLILAAIAVLGVLFIRGYQTGKQISAVEATIEPKATQEKPALQITLSSPTADIATSSARLRLTGTAAPGALVAITGAIEDLIVLASDNGAFETTVTLTEGLNMLVLTAFTDQGDSLQVKRNIVYTKGTL